MTPTGKAGSTEPGGGGGGGRGILVGFRTFAGNERDGLWGAEKAAPGEGGIKVQLDQGVPHSGIARRPPFASKVSVFQRGQSPARRARAHGKGGTAGTRSKSSWDNPKLRPEDSPVPGSFLVTSTTTSY